MIKKTFKIKPPKESYALHQILDWLGYNKFFYWRNNNAGIPGRRFLGKYGVPDIIVILPGGRFCGIEVKRRGEIQSDNQKQFEKDSTKLDAIYILAYSVDDVINGLANMNYNIPDLLYVVRTSSN